MNRDATSTSFGARWTLLAGLVLWAWSVPAAAQQAPDRTSDASTDDPRMAIEVRVLRPDGDGTTKPVADQGVVLESIRPGRDRQQVADEWDAVTDQEGVARFDIPRDELGRSTAIRAVTTHMSMPFRSEPTRPSDGASLEVRLFDPGGDLEDVAVRRLRTVLEPWEDYVVISQFWRLTARGERVIDTSDAEVDDRAKGLPIEFPTDAEGLRANGPGETEIVEGTVYWRGRLKPGRATRLRIRYSMPVSRASFVYRQRLDYPVEEAQVVLPLQPSRTTIERLDDAALTAPKFRTVDATASVPGLRRDNEYLFAQGRSIDPGDTLSFKLDGLPYSRPVAPWIAVGFAVFGLIALAVIARDASGRFNSDSERRSALRELEQERDRLADELARLERAHDENRVDDVDYETERLRLREQLAVVLRRLDDLREDG